MNNRFCASEFNQFKDKQAEDKAEKILQIFSEQVRSCLNDASKNGQEGRYPWVRSNNNILQADILIPAGYNLAIADVYEKVVDILKNECGWFDVNINFKDADSQNNGIWRFSMRSS